MEKGVVAQGDETLHLQTRRNKPQPTEAESPFEMSELFFSTTDKRGVILTGNDVFIRVSGYSYDDLVGEPHNVIRHPDMPRAVFKLLWDYLAQGKTIAAYVKNMASNGSYYWVIALVTPVDDIYLSIRLKPSSPIFSLIQTVYSELRSIERKFEEQPGGRKKGIAASTERLLEILKSKGFEDYDAFMETALREELASRSKALAKVSKEGDSQRRGSSSGSHMSKILSQSERLSVSLAELFEAVGRLYDFNAKLRDKSQFISKLAAAIRLLSLNALIEATRLADSGAALSIIAERMAVQSDQVLDSIHGLDEQIVRITTLIRRSIYEISLSRLKIEMAAYFTGEIVAQEKSKEAVGSGKMDTIGLVRLLLLSSFLPDTKLAMKQLLGLNDELNRLKTLVSNLEDVMRVLEFVHVSGKVEAARLDQPQSFENIFGQVIARVAEGRKELNDFNAAVRAVLSSFAGVESFENTLATSGNQIETALRMQAASTRA